MSDYQQCFDKIILAEGGYVDDKNDPGGETKYGISKRQYPNLDIKNLQIEQVKKIYKEDYWDKVHGDEIRYPLNLFLFDCAVNQGVQVAIKLLQRTMGIQQDGILGVNTQKAITKFGKSLETNFMAERALYYTGTRNFDKFGRGWFSRIFKITREA
jgi:lysozyme family protein